MGIANFQSTIGFGMEKNGTFLEKKKKIEFQTVETERKHAALPISVWTARQVAALFKWASTTIRDDNKWLIACRIIV